MRTHTLIAFTHGSIACRYSQWRTCSTHLRPKGERDGGLKNCSGASPNAILPEGGSAHVEELNDPYLLWFWNSNVNSTAIALRSLMRGSSADHLVQPIVRWLLAARKKGRWNNTQENARVMEALVAYYRKYESEVPDFRAVVKFSGDDLVRNRFEGRSSEAVTRDMPMATLAAKAAPGSKRELTFTREGTGTLFYVARLRYASNELYQEGLDSGFRIERRYEPFRESGPAATPALSLQSGRARQSHALVQLDERTAIRGGDRSASGGLRAGRIVVRHDRSLV